MEHKDSETNEKQEIRKATRGFWKKILIGTAICVFLLGVVAWISLFRDVPLEISKETTILTEPLTADGKQVDYFRAIELECYPPNMKTDENGFRMIIREIGVSSESRGIHYAPVQIYEKLGLDPSIAPTKPFLEPDEFIENYVDSLPPEPDALGASDPMSANPEDGEGPEMESGMEMGMGPGMGPGMEMGMEPGMGMGGGMYIDPKQQKLDEFREMLDRPWTLEEMPMMADWLKTNSPALDVVVEAARKPSIAIPQIREDEDQLLFITLLPEIQRTRSFARGLRARANYRIATGELDKAIDDILACKAFGRHVGHNGFLVSLLVGLAIEGMADQIGIAGSLEHQPTEAQLQRLLDAYLDTSGEKMPPRIAIPKIMEWERYSLLDVVQKVAHAKASERAAMLDMSSGSPIAYLFFRLGFDWNTVIKQVNDAYDHPESIILYNSDAILLSKSLFPQKRSENLGNLLTSLFIPATDTLYEVVHRTECADRVKAITLAMLIYEKQHGTLPPAWTVDKKGKPLHSWRVLLLPYLGEDAKRLYEKIRLDEPWNSKHNRQFHTAVIPFYQGKEADTKPGETTFTVILGKKAAFRGSEKVKLDQFGPNSANLLLVAERKTPVCWMDPASEVNEKDVVDKITKDSGYCGPCFGFRSGVVINISEEDLYVPDPTIPPLDPMMGTPSGPMSLEQTIFPQLLDGTMEKIP